MALHSGSFNTMHGCRLQGDLNFYLRLQEDDGHGAVTWYRWIVTGWENVVPNRAEQLETLFYKEDKE